MTSTDTLTRPSISIGGFSADELRKRLATITIDGSGGLEPYANEDCERFIRTLHLVPNGVNTVLEIGANPYFTTILARWFRPELEFTLTNYFGGEMREAEQEISVDGLNGDRETFVVKYMNINVEQHEFEFENKFNCVLFCEVLEHLTNDPVATLGWISRQLSDGASLVMTTPNVARLENVARLMGGHNIYDPYSGYGPYGRHNREYTKHELWKLLQHCGFRPEILETHDVHENRFVDYFPGGRELLPMLKFRAPDLGQYHFTRSSKIGACSVLRPTWLYRSYPESEMSDD